MLAALAASGPSWQKLPQPVHQKQDALVLVLDLSYSMKSADLAPSRLDRARQKLLDLLPQRKEGQTGLIAYAGDAHIVTPLTDDTPTIANLLPALDPDMMPLPGSDPAAAVAQAVELLHSAGIREGRVLLVTDGISQQESQGYECAPWRAAARTVDHGRGHRHRGADTPAPRRFSEGRGRHHRHARPGRRATARAGRRRRWPLQAHADRQQRPGHTCWRNRRWPGANPPWRWTAPPIPGRTRATC